MKFPHIVLFGSLAVNAALAAVLVVRNHGGSAVTETKAEVSQANSGKADPAPGSDAFMWENLNQGSDQELVERFRAEGFPQEVIRRVAMARIDERFAARRRALTVRAGPTPYWRASYNIYDPADREDAGLRVERRELNREYAAAIEQLLGDYYSEYERARHRRDYGDLPSEKVRQLEEINKDYNELRGRVSEAIKGVEFPEDRAQLEYLAQERRNDLALVLTPEELEAYDLRASDTARSLRSQLANFDPSEDEYRAIFKVQEMLDRQSATVGLSVDESRRMREAQIKTVLSPDRFVDYRVKTSGSYRPVRDLVANLNLPTETIAQVIGFQHDITLRSDTVRNDTTLTTEQRNAQLLVLSQEATAKLTTALGPAGFESYQYIGRGWLGRLQPKPVTPKKN
jgi:hypothetical protein